MKKHVLLIEDDSFISQMYVAKLQELHIEVEVFANPVEAKEFLSTKPQKNLDLILLDLVLPDMTGYELLNWIKQQDEIKDIPVVVLSNLSAQKDINEAYDKGAVDYIVKSNYTPSEVMRVITKHLDLQEK